MYFAVSAQVRYNREMSSASFNFTTECCAKVSECSRKGFERIELTLLASVTVHVRLKRTWAREPLVADFALVLLLCG
jgi:hypothetical protein